METERNTQQDDEEEPPPGEPETITITLPNLQVGENEGMTGDPDEAAPNAGDASAELMLLHAAKHIKQARSQRALYQKLVRKSINDAKDVLLQHKDKTYTFVVDYGQNMELPSFKNEQPGTVYYFSPLNIYNLGVVNHAHVYEGKENDPKEHMYARVYHEGIAKKGMNNVCSLIMKTLSELNLLRDSDPGKELNIIFDNCKGQNKNNTVLRLVPFLVEMGFFKAVNFVFLVVGHTKNAADRLFNSLKKIYRHDNLYTMQQLIKALNTSKRVTVTESKEEDFLDYDTFFNLFYKKFEKKITQNNIFSCSVKDMKNNAVIVKFRESNRDCDKAVSLNCIPMKFEGSENFETFEEAMAYRPSIMENTQIEQIVCLGINSYKKVELRDKYRPNVPPEYQDDYLYWGPSLDERVDVKEETKDRGDLKLKKKLKVMQKIALKKIEEEAEGDVEMNDE